MKHQFPDRCVAWHDSGVLGRTAYGGYPLGCLDSVLSVVWMYLEFCLISNDDLIFELSLFTFIFFRRCEHRRDLYFPSRSQIVLSSLLSVQLPALSFSRLLSLWARKCLVNHCSRKLYLYYSPQFYFAWRYLFVTLPIPVRLELSRCIKLIRESVFLFHNLPQYELKGENNFKCTGKDESMRIVKYLRLILKIKL